MSFFESCIAVAVISSLTMIAVPSLIEARENYVLTATARQIAAKLQHTRIKAITRNQDCRFLVTSRVSFGVDCYATFWRRDENTVLPRGFTITANAAPRFHRRGNVSPSATITVWNTNGRHRRVVINIAGRVRVE